MTEPPKRNAGDPASSWFHLAPVVFVVLWSTGFPFLKMGLAHAEPITLLALRYALVLVVLLPLFLVLRPPLPGTAADWGHLAVVGLLVQALYFGLASVALYLGVSAGESALIISLQPILVALLAPRFAGERVGLGRWLGLGLGLAGAVLVIVARAAIEAISPHGVLAAAGAMAAMTAGALYEKRFGVSHHPVTSNLVQYVVALVACLGAAWLLEDMHVAWTGELYLALGYLIVANSLISITLLFAMIRRGEVSRVSALFFLVPPSAAFMAWLVLGETLPPLAWIGTALAAVGVAIAVRAPASPRTTC